VSVLDNLFDEPFYVMSPGNEPYTSAYKLTPQTKTNFLGYIGDRRYRNLFWFGHGSQTEIGYSSDIGGVRGPRIVSVSTKEISKATGNSVRRPHPYRLVFLHSCGSAGAAMPDVFGIDPDKRSVAYYVNKGQKARAFVGAAGFCTADVSDPLAYGESLGVFFRRWMDGFAVTNALSRAQVPLPNETRPPLAEDLTVLGALNLTIDSQ
jgi:hypothetical protein